MYELHCCGFVRQAVHAGCTRVTQTDIHTHVHTSGVISWCETDHVWMNKDCVMRLHVKTSILISCAHVHVCVYALYIVIRCTSYAHVYTNTHTYTHTHTHVYTPHVVRCCSGRHTSVTVICMLVYFNNCTLVFFMLLFVVLDCQ